MRPPIGFPFPCPIVSLANSSQSNQTHIRAMVVQLSSIVTSRNVNFSEISLSGDLDVVCGFDKVNACERPGRHDAGTMGSKCTVCNLDTFGIANRVLNGWSPETKVVERVDPQSLALRIVRCASSAVIEATLSVLRGRRESGG